MNESVIPQRKRLDKGDLFWLFYLIFFLIEPIARHSLHVWVQTGFFVLAFLALYLGFMLAARISTRLVLLGAMFFLGIVAFPFNAGSTCFMIYSAALLPFTISSLPWMIGTFALQSAILALEGLYLHSSPYNWFIGTLLIIAVGGSNIFFAQRQRANCKLKLKQEEIEALAAVAERERIARDLHDVLGHTLSVIVLKAELAGRLLDRELTSHAGQAPATDASSRPEQDSFTVLRSGETAAFAPAHVHGSTSETVYASTARRARSEIADVERTARTALAEVREAIGGYRARGLAAEIETARHTLASAGVTLTTEGELSPATLTAAEETVLALALREAVTNIVRHAQATTCRLRMVVDHDQHRLSIQDNGENRETREGNGLRGMRERVESLGGHLSLTRESGTHLVIELPLRAART